MPRLLIRPEVAKEIWRARRSVKNEDTAMEALRWLRLLRETPWTEINSDLNAAERRSVETAIRWIEDSY